MRSCVLVAASALALAGCLRHTSYDTCKVDGDCAAAGGGARCEPNGACSVVDPSCPSQRRWHSSAPSAGDCVPEPDASQADATDAPMVVLPAGRECVQGLPLPAAYSACAAMVDAKEARCASEMWNGVCVRWAEELCQLPCSQLAFIGSDSRAMVVRLSDDKVVWRDPLDDNENVVAGAWADFDNDGDPDLALVGGALLRVFKNTGYDEAAGAMTMEQVFSKSWSTIWPETQGFNGTDVQWVDYDDDGDLDVAFGGADGLVLFRNDGGDVFLDQPPLMLPVTTSDAFVDNPSIVRTAWGDANGDHFPELVVVRFGRPRLLFKNDHGALMPASNWTGEDYSFGGGVQWCNVDADPEPELILSGYSYVQIADNVAGAPSPTLVTLDQMPGSDVQCADLDGDGDLDLFVSGDDNMPARAYNNGASTIASFSQTWTDTTSQDAIGAKTQQWNASIGDLDGDHKLDAIAAGRSGESPIRFQRYTNVSTKNLVKLTAPAPDVLSAEQESARLMSFAPAIGH